MADAKNEKDADSKQNEKPGVGTLPASADSEREKDILIERLRRENAMLKGEIEARDALEKERADAEAKARSEKRAAMARVPVALVSMIGEGRRQIGPKEQLRKSELDGLVEGKHYEFVTIGG